MSNVMNKNVITVMGLGGGVSSEIMGGKFEDGFKVAFVTAAAAYAYSASTNYENNASWKRGEGVPHGPDGLGTYAENGRIPWTENVFGNNEPMVTGGFMSQGNAGSRFGNWLLGGAPISRVHDAWLSPAAGYGNLPMNAFTNWGTMPFAAALTYTALAVDYVNPYIISQNIGDY